MAHDCVKLVYDGGDKLFVPVENLDVLTRYGSAESGAVLDKLGGLGWQQRKARVKKRLKDMADALMKFETIDAEQVGDIMEGREPRPPKGWAGPGGGTSGGDAVVADVAAPVEKPIGGPAGEV